MTTTTWDEEYTERVGSGRARAAEILAMRGVGLSLAILKSVYGRDLPPPGSPAVQVTPWRTDLGGWQPEHGWQVKHDDWDLWDESDPPTARYVVRGGPHVSMRAASAALNWAVTAKGRLRSDVQFFHDPCTGGWVMSWPRVPWLPSTLEGDLTEAVAKAALIVAELL